MFPTNAMHSLNHAEAIKDYISERVAWQLSALNLVSGEQRLSEAATGIIKSSGVNLFAVINGAVDESALNSVTANWAAGQIILEDNQPKLIAALPNDISLTAEFSPNASDWELLSGQTIPLTSCSLESMPSPDADRMVFGYLTGLPLTFKSRRIASVQDGINLFIWATGSKQDYCHAVLAPTCTASSAQVAEGIEFALSLFLGTRVHWRTLTTVDHDVEKTMFSLSDLDHGSPFLPPIENTSDLDDDEVAAIIHKFLLYHLQKGYSEANYFMHQCWELSPATQLTARSLTVAVAIEGICRSVLSSLKKESDPVFEEIFEQIEKVTDSWIAEAGEQADTIARQKIKKRITDLLAKRNELGGKALIERAFAEIGCSISEEELKIWSKARNATAHGAFKRNKTTTQQILDEYHVCVALLYRFILTNMGYHGRFIDYASKFWPIATM